MFCMVRKRLSLFAVFSIISIFNGCVPIPVPLGYTDLSEEDVRDFNFFFIERHEIDEFLEQSVTRKEIIEQFGRPIRYRENEISYNACAGPGGIGVLILPAVPYPVAGAVEIPVGDADCDEVVFVFNDDDVFEQLIEKPDPFVIDEYSDDMTLKELGLNGDELAWTLWEKSKTHLNEKADQGDTQAQWDLYYNYPSRNSAIWLCRLADSGRLAARFELARLYFYGSEEVGYKFHGPPIPPSMSRSCMWIKLLPDSYESVKVSAKQFNLTFDEIGKATSIIDRMTKSQLVNALSMVADWQPGQCGWDFSEQIGTKYSNDTYLTDLCAMADAGSYSAMDRLGWIYEYGAYPGVNRNIEKAYMWYSLASARFGVPKYISKITYQCNSATHQDKELTARLLENWEEGQCERDIVPADYLPR